LECNSWNKPEVAVQQVNDAVDFRIFNAPMKERYLGVMETVVVRVFFLNLLLHGKPYKQQSSFQIKTKKYSDTFRAMFDQVNTVKCKRFICL